MTEPYAANLAPFIAGSWRIGEGRDAHAVVNPATGDTIAELPLATPADLDEALAAADRGFALWRATDADARSTVLRRTAELLRERSEDIARTLTREQGKPLVEARGEVAGSAQLQ